MSSAWSLELAGALAGFLSGALVLWFFGRSLARALIRWRLKNYRILWNPPHRGLPQRLANPRRVAVIGAGIAGVAAAVTLARRGMAVTLLDSKAYLGGKLGSWPVTLVPGETESVSHGFHAFFRHYYNLNRFLDSLQLRERFRSIGDYVILDQEGVATHFAGLDTTPVLNILSMAKQGIYRIWDVIRGPGKNVMSLFLEYDAPKTFAQLDTLSFGDFARMAQLPRNLKVAFSTFARAFFADEEKMSLAEVVKCFHFYYLSQDSGLVYDYPTQDYEQSLWAPIRAHLESLGVQSRLGQPVESLRREPSEWRVNEETFEHVVLATDVVGARRLIENAETLRDPTLQARFAKLKCGQRYAVLRLWVDRDAREGIPGFVITDRIRILDAITLLHRLEDESAAWVKSHGGAVLELHSYAVPDEIESSEEVRAALLAELARFFPELAGMQIRHQHFQLNRDFTAFHRGLYAERPTTDSGIPGLTFAGDWVKLPFPAMLLEGAFSSGLCAANVVLRSMGLAEEPIYCVPLKGLLAGMPAPPGRKALMKAAFAQRKSG